MINLFYKFEDYIPQKTNLKERKNGVFLIVMNNIRDIYYLNDTAEFIYQQFDGIKTISDIFYALVDEYGIEETMKDEVQQDIVNIIRDFQWQKIVKLKEMKKL